MVRASPFDTFGEAWAGDQALTGRALLDAAAAKRPDLVLMMLMRNEVPMGTVDVLRRRTEVANWFADDTWRYFAYSRHLAPHFSWVVTTSAAAKTRYDATPGVRAILSPWGYNPAIFHPVDVEPARDVGFVGQRYGRRGAVIEDLRSHGISVSGRGSGWPEGRVAGTDLARLFASTRVNLNFLESSAGPFQRAGVQVRGTTRADALLSRLVAPPRQLKARPFEITGCGGFLLTNDAPELSSYFEDGVEIVTFRGLDDLKAKVQHYLAHEDERRAIAEAGLRRAESYDWGTVLSTVIERAGATTGRGEPGGVREVPTGAAAPTGATRFVGRVLGRTGNVLVGAARVLAPSVQERRVAPWLALEGDRTLRLEYPLTTSSVVWDVGGYEGQWASDIYARYRCKITVFEAMPDFAAAITARFAANDDITVEAIGIGSHDHTILLSSDADSSSAFKRADRQLPCEVRDVVGHLERSRAQDIALMKVNIEGGEYDLLERLIDSGTIERIEHLQVQFHDFVPDAERRMEEIKVALRRTHDLTYEFPFVWEGWERRCKDGAA